MPITNCSSGVEAAERMAEPLTASLAGLWMKYLRRAPRSEKAHQMARDAVGGRIKPMFMLAFLLLNALRDGVPLEALLAWVDQLRDALVRAASEQERRVHGAPTFRSLLLNEAQAEFELHCVERDVQDAVKDGAVSATLEQRLRDASTRYELANSALCAAVGQRTAIIEARYPKTARPAAPARARGLVHA